MYLKSIEVHGFKSFANKIKFKFHNGITCIVGPNGSGKSNVADAVRWVLGEQRIKQLRGASMQDVIFSGTENRKPVSYAYVAITLDNSDHQLAISYDEVTIARRIYRSGESEYLMNGVQCRLKDVNELFYDTGIGKEGYSIIGQGQIDKILSGKPEERRELFDEAVGIVKFKRRKNTALKKLEDEKINLVRVKDILSEIEKQVTPLEKQAEIAKVYLQKKEDLKSLDVNMFLLENNRIKEQLISVEEKYKIAKEDLTATNEKYENIKIEYTLVQSTMEELETAIEQGRSMLSDTGLLRGKLDGEINVLKEQINSARGNEEHLKSRFDTVQIELDKKETEKNTIAVDKTNIDHLLSQGQIIRDESRGLLLQVQSKIEGLNTTIEENKNQIIAALNERATIKSKIGRFDTMKEQLGIRKAELNARILRAKSNEAEQEEIIMNLQNDFLEINNVIVENNNKQQVMEERTGTIHQELTDKDQQLRDTQVSYHQVKTKLDSIRNLTERYEGYGSSIKRVMEQKDSEKGLVGVVADIIKVEQQYETAIEIALGGNIQNIVTNDEVTAKRMIDYLKKNKLGRATFLPLTSMKDPQRLKQVDSLSEKGVIGLASDLVLIDSKFKEVAISLLGRIVVVDTIDNAVKIAKKYHYGIRMVTLEGELLVPGGAISGGAFRNNSNLLGRRREMEELDNKVKKTVVIIDSLLDEIEIIKKERNRLRLEIEEVKSFLQKQFIMQNTARLNVIKAEERKNEAEQGFDELKAEEKEIENQQNEIKIDKEAIIKELEQSENLEKSVEVTIIETQELLEEQRKIEIEQTSEVAERDVEVEKMLQQQGFQQQNLERVKSEMERFQVEIRDIKERINQSLTEVERKNSNIQEIEKTIIASTTTQNDAEIKLQEEIILKESLSAKQKNFFTIREDMAQRMLSLEKEVARLNAQRERIEESIGTQINYMWDEYGITLSDATQMRREDLVELSVMKREVAILKEQIRKLGDVNVNAIEDFKNLSERHIFLKTQHDDLVEAEESLRIIIEELDTAMRKKFNEKFTEISNEFNKVFKELFGGGKGTLELMEDEDILDAGIRIIAQPPGKKLQNMMQLSGGEKALTAIALLFAIQNMKPSPFCLLDEIEAALDESNVARFAKYLGKLTAHTQFIVITHRRGTMERADRLYGITMEEKGVSALVSVNLIDKELEN